MSMGLSLTNFFRQKCHSEQSEESPKALVFKEIPQSLRSLGMTKVLDFHKKCPLAVDS